jgi:type IV pilus assembly protein PilY1
MSALKPIRPTPRPPSPGARGLGLGARALPAFMLALGFSAAAPSADAQSDLAPPLPDALLLVDTSGSMEYKVGGDVFPACYPDGSLTSERSRWVDLVEVLTGTIKNYRCETIDRTAATFRDGEYGFSGPLSNVIPPYDYLYTNPYHRPLSGNCAVGPGTLPTNVWQFPDTALKSHVYSSPASACTTDFTQATDGILDAFQYQIRFGLMTFDPLIDAGKGYIGNSWNHATGIAGTWSYTYGSTSKGRPVNCTTDQDFEVGARNAAAPPWEGRMVPFGDPSAGSSEYLTKRAQIKKILLATRPYGPTPIAGLLKDASDFLTLDDTKDPLNTANDFGPYHDPYVTDSVVPGGCRKRFVVLLSDGQPNMDLRPDCSDGASEPFCPFKKPETIALGLRSADRPIETRVIGFALSKFTVKGRGEVTCNNLADTDFDPKQPSGLCNSSDADNLTNTALQACCALNRIAVAGGSGANPRALFADNREDLRQKLSQILNEMSPVTTRSPPAIGGAAGGSGGFRFFPSVEPTTGGMWAGALRRQRFECKSGVASAITPDANAQDDFEMNVNLHPQDRTFVSIRAGSGSDPVDSSRTIRPFYKKSPVDDGAGEYIGRRYVGKQDAFVSSTSAAMINVDDTTCTSPSLTADLCRDRYLKWLVGLNNGTDASRCTSDRSLCYLFGDILHSTPRVVGPPSDFVRDESYERFANNTLYRYRPMTLYTSTNDGFLHAFKVAPTDPADTDKVVGPGSANNELWAFIPPAILPHLRKQYPGAHQTLLDGVPIVKDVIATPIPSTGSLDDVRFQRTQSDAQKSNGEWRTVLLQSFGTQSAAGGGYFALDVTEPKLDSNVSNERLGPRFLWQLTTDASGNHRIFGRGTDPAIGTLFFDPTDGDKPIQIAVAVLPGGGGDPGALDGSGNGCPSTDRTFSGLIESDFTPRPRVRCYGTTEADQAARSLTVVRLDTGEIIRTFRQAKSEIADSNLQKLVNVAELDSPITGRPAVFPSETGAVADRAYVGDQDGRLWKVDLSAAKPSKWTMKLFFDAFPQKSSKDSTLLSKADDGQPITLPPVISVDDKGDITVNIATGDQETVGAASTIKNYVWSLTEKTDTSRQTSITHVNWFMPMLNGERVMGPMSLFNGQLFFTSIAPLTAADVSAHACALPSGKVWGMDYIRPYDKDQLAQGGIARMPVKGVLKRFGTAEEITGSPSAAMFGVAVAQLPSCATNGQSAQNDFLGYKQETTISSVQPGQFQLVMSFRDGTTPTVGTKVNVQTVDLQPPPSASRVDSWAAILE